jgi:hypothetical protein
VISPPKQLLDRAVTDDPIALAVRAKREAQRALRDKDRVGFREAAEKGWLAASAVADVAADRLGMKAPGGSTGRAAVLGELERRARLRRGSLLRSFESARAILHGECFYADKCPSDSAVLGILDDVKAFAEAAQSAKIKRRR